MASNLQEILAAPTLQAAADILGVSKPWAAKILASAGHAHYFRERGVRRHAEWVRRMKAGDSDAAIARDEGVSAVAVRQIRIKNKIPPLPRVRRWG